jgi:hypothetical protein
LLQPPYDYEDIRSVPVRQHALTVVAPVREDVRETLAARLDAAERAVQTALAGVKSLHFARFVLLDGPAGPCSRLAFESNHDGELGPHLEALARELAPFEDVVFGGWEGYRPGKLAAFVAEHALPASTFYLGHPGLSVEQIHNDHAVRRALEKLLDAEIDPQVANRDLTGMNAVALRGRLVAALAAADASLVTGPVDRGFPVQPLSSIVFWGTVGVLVVLAALLSPVLVPLVLLIEARERRDEPARDLVADDDPRLDPINAREDATAQNGLTHHVALRKGVFRKTALELVLWFLETARTRIAYTGTLGGISSIHFARWVLLDDDTLLFFSNYDGSWEAYLGEFVDKAHFYLTAVWTNTKWFPDTRGLVFDGAAKELEFKRWTRTCQVENRIWYSAYKSVTVSDVLRNERVRAGARGEMNEREAREWLALL